MRIKKGDTVQITQGKDRGKTGQVLSVNPSKERVIVENINVFKKHRRPKRQGEKGEVIEVAKPINASNVLPVCKNCNQGVRVGFRGEGRKKVRECKKCNRSI
jgi:large subunit ribosomal protein L24